MPGGQGPRVSPQAGRTPRVNPQASSPVLPTKMPTGQRRVQAGRGLAPGWVAPLGAGGGGGDQWEYDALGRRQRRRKQYGGGGGGGGGYGGGVDPAVPPTGPASFVTVSLGLEAGWFFDEPAHGSMIQVSHVELETEHMGVLSLLELTAIGDWKDQSGSAASAAIVAALADATDATYAELFYTGVVDVALWTFIGSFGWPETGDLNLPYSLGAMTLRIKARKTIGTTAGLVDNCDLGFSRDGEQLPYAFFLGLASEYLSGSFVTYSYPIDLTGIDV